MNIPFDKEEDDSFAVFFREISDESDLIEEEEGELVFKGSDSSLLKSNGVSKVAGLGTAEEPETNCQKYTLDFNQNNKKN